MFVVVFEVYPHATHMQQYLDFARMLRPELEQIRGFIDNERFVNIHNSGHILSLSTWSDEKALIRWRTHAHHHEVQKQGRSTVFANYRLRIGEVTADSLLPSGQEVYQQRFDGTEASRTKIVTLLELNPANTAAMDQQVMKAATIDPAHAPPGWVESDTFTSIYAPGKLVTHVGWSDVESAQSWYAAYLAPINHPTLRSRFVRIIRAYGMHERGEAPQYYPNVPSASVT